MRRDAGQNEDAGADDRSHAQARKLDGPEDAAQLILAVEFLDERFVRLYLEQLICHIHLAFVGQASACLPFERTKNQNQTG